MQLVYVIMPKIPIFGSKSSYVRQKERMECLKIAQDEYGRCVAERRLKRAQNVRGPSLHELNEGDLCFVFREESKRWEGPARIVSIDAGNVIHVVQKGGKVSPFLAACVRSYMLPTNPNSENKTSDSALVGNEIIANTRYFRFDEVKAAEMQQLLKRDVFKWVPKSEVPVDANILRSKWVLVVKTAESDNPIYKARLVIQGHRDPLKGKMVTEAPTLITVSTRLIACLAASYSWTIFSKDITSAFLQSDKILREIYITLPAETIVFLGTSHENILKLCLPQYGITEAPTYWWITFQDYLQNILKCKTVLLDPCLFLHFNKSPEETLDVIIGTLCGTF
jgi:Reverse transcriptase (RNA-dependent DNA polymerase)